MRVTQNGAAALQVMRRVAWPVPPVSRSALDGWVMCAQAGQGRPGQAGQGRPGKPRHA